MSPLLITGIAIGLSMDAFAVSLSSGCSMPAAKARHILAVAFSFGLFQAVMPVIGWYGGTLFRKQIEAWDHWIAFGLLLLIGLHMIIEGIQSRAYCEEPEQKPVSEILHPIKLLLLSVATSIDALAVGLSFSLAGYPIFPAALFIGVVTFLLSALGVKAGGKLYHILEEKVEILGGLILIAIGVEILVSHLSA
jgi:manganese efflux pump family protein